MILQGDTRSIPLPDGCVQTIPTSPPYWGLRSYELGDSGIGLEPTLDAYIENMLACGREWWRVLRDDGTLWLNLGDTYAAGNNRNGQGKSGFAYNKLLDNTLKVDIDTGMKPKNLVGLPWRVAFAFQEAGWYLRSDIIWAKPNPMPESTRDRPTKAHEYVFLLTKSPRYFYDAEAVREAGEGYGRGKNFRDARYVNNRSFENDNEVAGEGGGAHSFEGGRNRRTVWTIPTQPYRGAHFATFPEKLVEPCILAGTSPKACGVCGAPWERVTEKHMVPDGSWGPGAGKKRADAPGAEVSPSSVFRTRMINAPQTIGWRPTCDHNDDTGSCLVLDPFCGSGTTGVVAQKHGRRFVGVDLNPDYLKLAEQRIAKAPIGMGL